MKKRISSLLLLTACFLAHNCAAYERQGTTITKGVCDVTLTLQIALETDAPGDVKLIQDALDACFAITCDLPCLDGKTGSCKVISKVIVVNQNTLSAEDMPKFHQVLMLPDTGTSFVMGCGVPNSGSSTKGVWYRVEYSPAVYCHEAMHLCGLDDHYRDCRGHRVAAGVDNCKDGKTCTPEQIARGACLPCDGYEHDCMGNDVTQPFDCNRNIMEVVRMLHDPNMACSEECCKKENARTSLQPKLQYGLLATAGVGHYRIRDKEDKDDKLNLTGYDLSVGGYGTLGIDKQFSVTGTLRLDFSTVSKKKEETRDNGPVTTSYEDHYAYRFIGMYLGINAEYRTCPNWKVFAGPEFGILINAKDKHYGSYTSNGMTTNHGDKTFHKITADRNFQIGLNIGASRDISVNSWNIQPYIDAYVPLTNQISFPNTDNKLYRLSIGARVPLGNF